MSGGYQPKRGSRPVVPIAGSGVKPDLREPDDWGSVKSSGAMRRAPAPPVDELYHKPMPIQAFVLAVLLGLIGAAAVAAAIVEVTPR